MELNLVSWRKYGFRYLAGAGTQASALAFGGTPPNAGATEEWTGPGAPLTQTITVS
jgi:hypothetical protein